MQNMNLRSQHESTLLKILSSGIVYRTSDNGPTKTFVTQERNK